LTEGRTAAFLGLVLVAAGVFAWTLYLRPGLVADTDRLSGVPQRIGTWIGEDDPLADGVEDVLRADFNLKRAYRGPSGELVWLYVGYYGTSRGGRPEHTPRGCYTGAGWGIAESRVVVVDPNGGLRVQEYLVERGSERRLVHYWYRSHRRTGMVGGLDQNVDRVVGRLMDGRSDGALIRISTTLDHRDVVTARSMLIGFAASLDPLLAERWPDERPLSEAS
jgi:EpsI family protein